MRSAVIHIGTNKTGTTAIQAFCFENAEVISSCGFWYPKPRTPNTINHVDFALAHGFFRNTSATNETSLNAGASFADHPSPLTCNLLISSEHMCVHSGLAPLKRLRRWLDENEFHSVRIVVYLRNQVDWVVSSYAESLKWQLTWDFDAFYELNRPRAFYGQILSDWADIFGEKNVIVRSYDDIGRDVVEDFVSNFTADEHVLGLAGTYAHSLSNASTSQILLEDLRKNTVETDRGEFNGFLVNLVLGKRPGCLKELFHRRIWNLPKAFVADLQDISSDNDGVMAKFGLRLSDVIQKEREYTDSVARLDPEKLRVAASWIWKDLG